MKSSFKNICLALVGILFIGLFAFVGFKKIVIASESFLPLGQGAKSWADLAVDSGNHNVYAAVLGGDVYEQVGGVGNFIPLGQTSRSWNNIDADSGNHDVYAVVYGGDVYKQTGGVGDFLPLGQSSLNPSGVAVDSGNHNVYINSADGNIYKQTGGAGSFSLEGQTPAYSHLAIDSSNHNVYGFNSSDVYEQAGGVGDFIPLGQTHGFWLGGGVDSGNHDVYTMVINGDIYKQAGGVGDFLPMGQTPREWTDADADSSNHYVYATVAYDDIYKMIPSGPLAAGAVCNSGNPGACRGSGDTWYEYDFYLPDRVTVGASFRYPELIKDYTPSNLPITGFNNFYSDPGPASLNACDMTSNSSAELDCLSSNPHGGIFEYHFNFGAMPRSLGSFTGSGWDAPDHSVPSESTVFLQDGEVKTVLKDGPDPLCGQIKVTWSYSGIVDRFKIYKDGHYIGSAAYPNDYFIYNTGADFTPHTYSISAVVDGVELAQDTWNGNPVAANSCAAPATVTLDNSTCGQMVVNWTGVAGSGVTYSVYRNTSGNPPDPSNDLIQSGLTSSTYTDTVPPAASSTPYYYFVAAIGSSGESLATGGVSNPSSIAACVANLNDSDIDIVKVNGNQLYINPSLPNGSQCDSSTDALPPDLNLKLGDLLKFSANLCNDQGNGVLGLTRITNPLINLSLPQGYTDFNAYFNASPLTYDGVQASSYNPAPGHYSVYGSAPNQVLVFNLTGDSINPGSVAALTYEAQLAVPSGFVGSLSRFQSSFSPVYTIGSGPSRFTPLLPFIVGPNYAPSFKEAK